MQVIPLTKDEQATLRSMKEKYEVAKASAADYWNEFLMAVGKIQADHDVAVGSLDVTLTEDMGFLVIQDPKTDPKANQRA